MNRRGFLRSLIAGAGAIAAARVLPALAATENPIFAGFHTHVKDKFKHERVGGHGGKA